MARTRTAINKRNKVRGYLFEKEVVQSALDNGLGAERTWGSNGESRGLPHDVDVVVTTRDGEEHYLQCKRMKVMAKNLIPSDNVLAQVVRADNLPPLAIIPLDLLWQLIATMKRPE